MEPRGAAELVLIDLWAVQDGLGIVLVRSFFRLAVRDHFFGASWVPLGVVLGRLWPRFGSSWALLGSFLGTPCRILESYNPICPSTHQLINP